MRKYRNRILAGFAIGFVIYAALLVFVNTGDLLNHLQVYPWGLLVPVILLKFVAWFCRFMQWHYYLGVIGANDKISRFDSAVLFISGFTMAVSPGKIAEMLKSVVLKTKTGIPIARSAPVIIAERVVDGVAVIVMAVAALLLAGDGINLGDYRFMIMLSAGLLIFGLVAVQIRPLAYFALDMVGRLPLVRRLHEPLVAFYESSFEIFKLKHVIPTSLFGMVAATTDAVGFVIILTGFGVPYSDLLLLQAMVIVCLSSAIGALSGVPNGAGITEVSVSAMLMAIVAPA
ncbi:MAG: flippase-like domain-containing protein, partial [Anaerolineae bacterium]|nr:flippase-like domain-containing protein [Anaerolineae bacterium]